MRRAKERKRVTRAMRVGEWYYKKGKGRGESEWDTQTLHSQRRGWKNKENESNKMGEQA